MTQPYQLAGLFALPAVVSMAVGLLIFRQQRSKFESLLVLLMMSTGLWALGYSCELASATPFWYWVWGIVQYVGIATAPPVFFLLMIHYAGIEEFMTRPLYVMLWTIPIVSVFLRVTDPLFGFLHKATTIHVVNGFAFQMHQAGPWFWVQIFFSHLMMFSSIMILLYFRSRARLVHRRHMTSPAPVT